MVCDSSDVPDHSEEERQPPAPENMARRASPAGPFSLASLLDLSDDDLALPPVPAAPPSHRWEQLTLGDAPENGQAVPSTLQSGDTLLGDDGARALHPGLDAPGAVEIPVYLAGRALHDYLTATPSMHDVVDGVAPPTALGAAPRVASLAMVPATSSASPTPVSEPSDRMATQQPVVALLTLRLQCANCIALPGGEQCYACGGTSAVRRKRRLVHDIVTAAVTSQHRPVRTLAALIFAPGELTAAHVAGQTRRFVGPALVAVVALILFAVISFVGSVRPRPDRALIIGTGRTAELAARVVEPIARRGPTFIHEVAAAINFVPVLFLPLMGVLVFGVTVGGRLSAGRDADAALPFTAYFLSWYVLWWGAGVPALLLLLRAGLETAAVWDGVQQGRYLADGRPATISDGWIAARGFVSNAGFHSALLMLGLLPWAVLAWRRAFSTAWLQAAVAGLLITMIPLILLLPFG